MDCLVDLLGKLNDEKTALKTVMGQVLVDPVDVMHSEVIVARFELKGLRKVLSQKYGYSDEEILDIQQKAHASRRGAIVENA